LRRNQRQMNRWTKVYKKRIIDPPLQLGWRRGAA